MWIVETEKEILSGKFNTIPDKTFGDLMDKYGKQVSPTKRGGSFELKRISKLSEDEISKVKLSELNQTHFASWRDRRLQSVKAGTVLRDWNLITHALNVAKNEWKWLLENPIKGVKRPKEPPHRERRIEQDEIDRLLFALGYEYTEKPETVSAMVGAALLFAIETAMRAGEIASLTWGNVDLEKRVARLPMTKNGFARDVPLSTEAIRIIEQLRSVNESVESVFNLRTSQIDALFRKAKGRAMIENLTFHDSRHEAITRLAGKLSILELARVTGHRDLKMLQIYFNMSVADMAKKLD